MWYFFSGTYLWLSGTYLFSFSYDYALSEVSGGVFNPAVAVGISLMHLSAMSNILVFLAENFGVTALAGLVFKLNDT